MKLEDVQSTIESIRYKPGSVIALAPVQGRLFNPEAGALRLIIKMPQHESDGSLGIKHMLHSKELPPAHLIRDSLDLMRLVRIAIMDCETYEMDQWLSASGIYPFRRDSSQLAKRE